MYQVYAEAFGDIKYYETEIEQKKRDSLHRQRKILQIMGTLKKKETFDTG